MSADPIALLDRLSPPPGWSERTDLDADPVAAQILDQVFAGDRNVISLDDARRRRRGIGGAIVVAALVAGGAVAAIWNRTPSETARVSCWSEAVADPPEVLGLPWDGQSDPATMCADEWSSGVFRGSPPPDELEMCVTENNIVAVIPGAPGACGELGLDEFSPSPDDSDPSVIELQRRLDRAFNNETCQPPDRVMEETRTVLDEVGLNGWSIIAGAESADEPCATVLLVPEKAEVIVLFVARQP